MVTVETVGNAMDVIMITNFLKTFYRNMILGLRNTSSRVKKVCFCSGRL
jgi:hypothetical protein